MAKKRYTLTAKFFIDDAYLPKLKYVNNKGAMVEDVKSMDEFVSFHSIFISTENLAVLSIKDNITNKTCCILKDGVGDLGKTEKEFNNIIKNLTWEK